MHTPLDLSGMTKQWLPPYLCAGGRAPPWQDKVESCQHPAHSRWGSAGLLSMSKSHLVPFLGCLPLFGVTRPTGRVQSPAGAGAVCSALSVQQSRHWCGPAAHLPNLMVNAQGAFLNVLHVGHNRFIN